MLGMRKTKNLLENLKAFSKLKESTDEHGLTPMDWDLDCEFF